MSAESKRVERKQAGASEVQVVAEREDEEQPGLPRARKTSTSIMTSSRRKSSSLPTLRARKADRSRSPRSRSGSPSPLQPAVAANVHSPLRLEEEHAAPPQERKRESSTPANSCASEGAAANSAPQSLYCGNALCQHLLDYEGDYIGGSFMTSFSKCPKCQGFTRHLKLGPGQLWRLDGFATSMCALEEQRWGLVRHSAS
jgi:hypothetical protein